MAIADRIVVMSRGRIEDDGTPERIYLRPRTRFVADFMGLSCFLPGRVTGADGRRIAVATEAGEIRVADDGDWRPGDAVTLSIRPEHFLTGPGDDGRQPLGEAVVQSLSFLGTHHHASVRHASAAGFEATIMLPQSAESKPGDRLTLWVRPDTPVVLKG